MKTTNHLETLISESSDRAKENKNKYVLFEQILDLSEVNSKKKSNSKNPNIIMGQFDSFLIVDNDRGDLPPVELSYRISKTSSQYLTCRSGSKIKLENEIFNYLEFFNESTLDRTIRVQCGLGADFEQNVVELTGSGATPTPDTGDDLTASLVLTADEPTLIAPDVKGVKKARSFNGVNKSGQTIYLGYFNDASKLVFPIADNAPIYYDGLSGLYALSTGADGLIKRISQSRGN